MGKRAICQCPKWVEADWAQYVWLSSSLIIVGVMTFICNICAILSCQLDNCKLPSFQRKWLNASQPPNSKVAKSPFEIAAKWLKIDLMCQWGTERNLWASYWMCPSPDFHVPQTEGLQIGGHRLSTSCAVVKRPDHHCSDDLVLICLGSFLSFSKALLNSKLSQILKTNLGISTWRSFENYPPGQ